MIQKVLIANRGEIAVRLIRALRELNIKSVAVYSTVEKDALHVLLADEALCIGDHRLEQSYLNQTGLIQAALNAKAQAIHPGYGFLSEQAAFARACEEAGLIFIGPSFDLIALMGDKQKAKEAMIKAGVPVVPGSKGLVKDLESCEIEAARIGYPVLIKATAGGGGKGMRICRDALSLREAYAQSRREARAAFGDDRIYLERYIENPRHIEVQILADGHGQVIHLGERDCSVQSGNQKLIEEAPARLKGKERLHKLAVEAARSIGYQSVGTMEFIVDQDDRTYFIEMNTRLQVEHPVTELITGVDIVSAQINIAQGKKLNLTQAAIQPNGHAIELRVNANNPQQGFKPELGMIQSLHFPGGHGVRIDSHLYQGWTVQPYYDALLAKIIVHGQTRDIAIEKAIRCLEELDIDGISTNQEFLLELLLDERFLDNMYTTNLVKEVLGDV